AGLGDAGLDDAGLDDAGLDDAGLDDAGLDDAGPPEDAAVVDAAPLELPIEPIAPITGTAPPEAISAPTSESTTETTVFAIKVIGGLIVLLALAYVGGHRRVVRFQERFGFSGVISAGFPFIALGLVAGLPSVGILTGEVLDGVRPVLLFGLGWLGFIIGAQLDIRVLERVPTGTAYMILVESVAPFVITVGACGGVMIAFGMSWRDPGVWRDVVLLGAAAAMTAPLRYRGFASRRWRQGRGADVLIAQLDELVGVIGLLFITAYFRGDGESAWQLPETAWVFVSLGIGVTVGVLILAMVRVPASNAEFLAIVLGGIAFAAGYAGYLRLSPLVVCFVAGVLVTNFPNDARANIFRILRHLERPVHLLFLIVAGAVWSVTDWRGWALIPVFVIARVLGKWLGVFASRSVVEAPVSELTGPRTLFAPMSALSIALVISTEGMPGNGLTWVVTVVIGGAIVTELLVQATGPLETKHLDTAARLVESTRPAAAAERIDELDADDPPTYRDDEPRGPA
ncbi:MAG: cation:proton antiporter, partial [Myxococcota bacterium]|nr:cation:proton antiporter [Myxococcota bacterium]